MTKFAFIIHPLKPKDLARQYPWMRYLPDPVLEAMMVRKTPIKVSEIRGVRSITGSDTQGWFIGCPLTPAMMVQKLPLEQVYEKIGQCAELAASLGAELIGLGAFTSVVGDGGITVANNARIAVTTGNSYTVATAIEGTLKACDLLEIDRSQATLAVVGATGSIGKTCALLMAPGFERVIVIGRDRERTTALAALMPNAAPSVNVEDLRAADVIVTVTSSDAPIIQPNHLKPGAIVCDVARPRDVSVRVAKERPDVLVIEGGVVQVPGDPEFGFDFGFPKGTAYACMCETMMLALDGRPENFTLGKDVTPEQVSETQRLAGKHGFKLAGFRSFEKAVDEASIDRARQARRQPAAVR